MLQNATVQIAMELWGAIICAIFASFIFIGVEKNTRRGNLLIALLMTLFLLLISDCIAWAYRGNTGRAAYWAVRISNYLVFILNYAAGYLALQYLKVLLAAHQCELHPRASQAVTGICILGFLEVTISQFTGFLYYIDADNLYHRAGGYWTICVVAGVMVIMMIAITSYYSYKKHVHQTIPLLSLFVLILLATIVQTFLYGISLVNIAMSVGVVLMFFAYEKEHAMISSERETQLLENELRLAQQKTALTKKDAEMAAIYAQLVEKRTQIMLSQIQPHFLYNALSAISSLCILDPMKAKDTIDNFALYLRMNLDSLKNDQLVPFEQELQHTKAYLAIEQTRFGDDLKIAYDIQFEDFVLPSLSIQPLAENAVRHGICGSEDGGTVTIRTERKDGRINITVADDGTGFDTSAKPQDDRTHVGMENVTQRIRTLCGGDVIIDSMPGYGTTATITLPDQKGQS